MRLHTYVVEHDVGFAPNPFWGFCSLANCKPKIRKYARVGDIIVGTASAKHNKRGHLVYWMKVDEIVTFDDYWNDKKFEIKKPNLYGSVAQHYGDNIYYTDDLGMISQIDSFHSQSNGVKSTENMRIDTSSTNCVLIGNEYIFFGKDAPKIPAEFSQFIVRTQGHKNHFESNDIQRFIAWLTSFPFRGFVNYPLDW